MRLDEALGSQEEALLNCVHCGFCLPSCPTYVRLGDEADSPRGRLHLMRAVVEGRLDPASAAFQEHMDRCLGCRACEPVCPSGVEYGMLLERARQVARSAKTPGLLTRLLLTLVGRDRVRKVWLAASRLLRASGLPSLLGPRLPAWRGLAAGRTGLAMLASSAPAPLERVPAEGGGTPKARATSTEGADGEKPLPGEARSVGLLTGCVQEGLFARVNRATERVLAANGFDVRPFAGQGCCGALHAHAGDLEGARRMARRNVEAFERSGAELFVVNAAGCGAAMVEYGHLLAEDPAWAERARTVSERVRDVSQLLGGEAGCRPGAPLPLRVAYDPPCHLLHAQRIRTPPLRMLEAVPALEVVPVPGGEECCGGAGIYGLTHPDLGGRIGTDKVEAVLRTEAPWLATGNPGCLMQIGAGLRLAGARVEVCHPVELLDESYRRAGLYGGRRGPPGGTESGGRGEESGAKRPAEHADERS